jgi:hypothetical protein
MSTVFVAELCRRQNSKSSLLRDYSRRQTQRDQRHEANPLATGSHSSSTDRRRRELRLGRRRRRSPAYPWDVVID